MSALHALITATGLSQRAVATRIQISPAALCQIVNHDSWPRRNPDVVRSKLTDFLIQNGLDVQAVNDVLNPAITPTAATKTTEDELMLLRKQNLTPAAKKHFSLFSNPFTGDIQSAEELYQSSDVNYVRMAMYQAAKMGGFIAVTGESGSGKTTLRRDLLDRIQRERLPIVTIEPYVIAAEDNDVKGKTLKASHIAEAILAALAPLSGAKRSPEARFRQIHNLLKESSRAGNQHVIIIEEAHSLPIPTLKHLKRFFELEDGYKKLLSIVLIGQNELALKLSEQNLEVREVVQRCEIVTLDPLTQTGLVDYLQHRIKPTGRPLADIISTDGVDAIADRLTAAPARKGQISRSLLYPLAVGNLITGAMNLAADLGVPTVNADIVREV